MKRSLVENITKHGPRAFDAFKDPLDLNARDIGTTTLQSLKMEIAQRGYECMQWILREKNETLT